MTSATGAQAFRVAIRTGTDGWAHAFIAPPAESADQAEGAEVPDTWIPIANIRILPDDPGDAVRTAFVALCQAMATATLRGVGVTGEIAHQVIPAARPGMRRQ